MQTKKSAGLLDDNGCRMEFLWTTLQLPMCNLTKYLTCGHWIYGLALQSHVLLVDYVVNILRFVLLVGKFSRYIVIDLYWLKSSIVFPFSRSNGIDQIRNRNYSMWKMTTEKARIYTRFTTQHIILKVKSSTYFSVHDLHECKRLFPTNTWYSWLAHDRCWERYRCWPGHIWLDIFVPWPSCIQSPIEEPSQMLTSCLSIEKCTAVGLTLVEEYALQSA